MGKLLHRLIHGMWPSWLTRINASDASATKRLLMPFFRAGNLFSNKPSAASSSSSSSSSPRSPTNSTFYSESEDGNQAPMKANNEILAASTPTSQPTRHAASTTADTIKTDHGGSQGKSEDGKATQGRGRRIWLKRKKREKEVSCELPKSLCEMVGASSAVVRYSHDPHHELWESMVDMIVSNGLWEATNLEFLLFCYLSLNEPHLHQIIEMTFLQVLQDLSSTSS